MGKAHVHLETLATKAMPTMVTIVTHAKKKKKKKRLLLVRTFITIDIKQTIIEFTK